MSTKYWIKLYHEILDDPKMGRLPNNLWRRFIECCLLAGEFGFDDDHPQNGRLPAVGDMSWRLRVDEDTLAQELDALARRGLLEYRADNVLDGYWFVTSFNERQRKMSKAEYMRRLRAERANVTDELPGSYPNVTNGNADIDKDIDKDIDTEKTNMPAIAAEYAEFLMLWEKHLPEKPQPRRNNKTLQGKLKTRLKCTAFQESWRDAVARAGRSSFLKSSAWFDAYWFLKNDANWEKCNNGNYDDRANGNGRHQHHGQAYGYDNDILQGVQVFDTSDAITR